MPRRFERRPAALWPDAGAPARPPGCETRTRGGLGAVLWWWRGGLFGRALEDAELVALRVGERHPSASGPVDPTVIEHLGRPDAEQSLHLLGLGEVEGT